MAERIKAIEYIRGVAMLGVIGIHTGAYSLTGPAVNVHLFALLEIASRFSVPIFFFVSAFGLFRHYPPDRPISYAAFYRRRCLTVLVPYLVWSLLYLAHATWVTGEIWPWTVREIAKSLLFGLASYQLYFLVILLWFYALMPLWRAVVPAAAARPLPWLGGLLVLQIAFNYWSCYGLTEEAANHYINLALKYRMSFWVLHYVFVFVLGGVCALRLNDFAAFAVRRRREIDVFFTMALAGMLANYYWLLYGRGYLPEGAVNTVHQLSPEGVVYTLAACLFLFRLFDRPLPDRTIAPLALLARHSYVVYLVHPLVMHRLTAALTAAHQAMTTPVVIAFYAATVAGSLLFAAVLARITAWLPAVGLLLAGMVPKKAKPGALGNGAA
jgi:Uncharacterized protein conserved in bacteria